MASIVNLLLIYQLIVIKHRNKIVGNLSVNKLFEK